MFSWCVDFFSQHSAKYVNYALVFAFGDLLVSTLLQMAFGGLIRLRVKLHGKKV